MIKHINSSDIQRFLDGDTTARESAEIKFHLNICQHCWQEYESYIMIYEALQQEPSSNFSSQFTHQVLSRIKSSPQRTWYQRTPDFIMAITGIAISILASLYFIGLHSISNSIILITTQFLENLPTLPMSTEWLSVQTINPYFLTGIIILIIIILLERLISSKKGFIYSL
jgi:hypothetical protein